jgi:hypothetical protein
MKRIGRVWMTLAILFFLGAVAGRAQDLSQACRQLNTEVGAAQFSTVPDAPTQIVTATVVPAGDGLPARCDVRGYITTHVQFGVLLPLTGWNGKLLESGCGGFCGGVLGMDNSMPNSASTKRVQAALKRGYAVTTTDMGHTSRGVDAKWAYNNIDGKIDFAYRATHVTVVAAKAIVRVFYGQPQKYAYFQGCSTGGRQGFMEAQRFPDDFDGVIAGAGPLYYSTSGFQLMWSALATVDENRKPILQKEQVELLHKAVLDKCDLLDGVKDGIIGDPRSCSFDPAEIACKGTATGSCLTPPQVEAARKIYQGPVNSKGQPIHVGADYPGSELNWMGGFVGDETTPPLYIEFPGDKFRYMTFFEDPGPKWTTSQLDWDRDPARAADMGVLYSATNPDLRKLQASGHKLLAYQGWADEQVTPANLIQYRDMVVNTMGGKDKVDDYYRFFLLPGVNHCGGGAGADDVDYLTAMENWVEKGEAPKVLIGKHVEGGKTLFTRPYFDYPDEARYSGKGDVNDAKNWIEVKGPTGKGMTTAKAQ